VKLKKTICYTHTSVHCVVPSHRLIIVLDEKAWVIYMYMYCEKLENTIFVAGFHLMNLKKLKQLLN
jgi:hypothetical protein